MNSKQYLEEIIGLMRISLQLLSKAEGHLSGYVEAECEGDEGAKLPEGLPGEERERAEDPGEGSGDGDGGLERAALEQTFPASEQGEDPKSDVSVAGRLAVEAMQRKRSRVRRTRRYGRKK